MRAFLVSIIILLCMNIAIAEESKETRKITVDGQSEIAVQPDYAVLSLQIRTWESSLDGSKEKNDDIYGSVLEIAEDYEIKDEDIKSEQIRIKTTYLKDKERIDKNISGFDVDRNIEITLRSLEKYEGLLTELISSGINYINNIKFHSSEAGKYKREALLNAVKAAKEKAEQMAAVLDQKIGKPILIDETTDKWWGGRQSYYSNTRVSAGNFEGVLEAKTGKISIVQRVSVVFELE